ncbi:MAG TPA: chemotaxis protein, partial [Microvirga sp.]|nr:chemotaxis protein [Microvirga sp.]
MRSASASRLPKKAAPVSSPLDVQVVVRELAAVAEYIKHIKREIAALRANELCRDRIPMAHEELG